MNFLYFFYMLVVYFIILTRNGKTEKILVLGGNGFLGNSVVRELLQQKHQVTILCRCKNYFDSQNDVLLYVNDVIRCNRDKTRECDASWEEITESSYDYVIDFSAFERYHIENLLNKLRKWKKMYIFISTVAVYDVLASYNGDKNLTNDELKKVDEENVYATKKLLCEETLRNMSAESGFRYAILQLPDVIGVRDTSFRIWHYQLLIKMHKQLKIKIPLPNIIRNKTFHLVHNYDVTRTIIHFVNNYNENMKNEILNVSTFHDVTLETLIGNITTCMGIKNVAIETDEEWAWYKYPTNGQTDINITRFKEIFKDLKTIKFENAICEIVDFNERAMTSSKYNVDRELFLAEFVEETLPDYFDDIELFVSTIRQIYGEKVFEGVDIGLDESDDDNSVNGHTEL